MTDQWERLKSVMFAVSAAIFGAILPSINSVVGVMADGIAVISGWVTEFPILGEILGYVTIAAISLGGVVAGLSLAMGIGQMMSAGWALTMGTLSGVFRVLRISTLAMTASTWLFNAALWANPMTWVVAGIVGLVAAIGAAIYYWDEIKATFGDTAVFKFLGETIDWVIDKLNMIPGIDIAMDTDMPSSPEMQAVASAAQSSRVDGEMGAEFVAPYKQKKTQTPLPYNMVSNATSVNKSQTGATRSYGNITINSQQPFTPDQLAEWEELNAG